MKRRVEIYVFAGLLVTLAVVVYFRLQSAVPGIPGVLASEGKFKPLEVQEPQLRLQLLEKIQKLEYTGSHRNIFVAAPPPPPQPVRPVEKSSPVLAGPPPPPPLEVPAQFFGYTSARRGGKRAAFFTSGEDVLIVPEGDTFLSRFRLVHIGNDSADIEEMSTGRHTTLQMVQPPEQQVLNSSVAVEK